MQNKDMFTKAVEKIGSLNSLITVMEYYNINFKKDSSGYFTNCMFHNDNTPSLRLTDKGKKAIYKCFGCEAQGDIINFICNMEKVDNVTALKKAYDILGLELEYKAKENNKIVNFKNYIKTKNLNIRKNNEIYTLEDIYIYSDENKNPLYCKIKYKSDENKKYFITKNLIEIDIGYKFGTTKDFEECKKVLYNLEQIKKSISKNEWIFFVEGEKDVKTLKKLNKPATTIYTRKWQESYIEDLKGAKVAFIGDSGKSGEEFKNFVVEKLKKCCEGLKIIDLPGIEKIGNGRNKDITDWLENGHTEDELLQLLKKSRDILDESFLQQDEYGIYKIKNTIENNMQKKVRYNLTNFQIVDGVIYKNQENNSQKIKLNIISDENEKYTVEYDGRKLFSSVTNFRQALGIDHIFYGNDEDLTSIHKYVLMYFVKEEIYKEKNNLEVKNICNYKNEYEIVLEDIDELIFENENMRILKDIHYKILTEDYIAFDFESIYKKLNKYYKTYKDNKLLSYHIFINLICRSPYIMNSLKPYRDIKIIYDNENYKIKRMYILKISELKKLDIDNIFINIKK